MVITFALLKETAQHGTEITNGFGNVQNCFTPLVVYVIDLLEQQLLTSVSKNASPVTTATISQFGDPFPHLPHSGHHTL
ncbi:hypothetical protein J3R82DRAFT_3845 [Butyriboletus roseoflavus]|nr:hypothetical protein J3R82DRAFT_3845 [Butyriboletus roseoflavus]